MLFGWRHSRLALSFRRHTPPSVFIQPRRSEKPIQSCSPLATNRRGANPTRPHERHREAPLREARQAAPDGARASAALSSSENSRFSRGTWPLRRKSYGSVVMSYIAANSIAEGISNKLHRQVQLCREDQAQECQMPTSASEQASLRAATNSRDENLDAKFGAAAGGSEEERKRERLSEPTRSILDAPAVARQSKRFSSRCSDDEPNGSPREWRPGTNQRAPKIL